MPYVVFCTGRGKFRDGWWELVPVDAIDDANRGPVPVFIRVHGVDKEVAVGIDVHARYFSLRRHHHDSGHQFRRGFFRSVGRCKRRGADHKQEADGEQHHRWFA